MARDLDLPKNVTALDYLSQGEVVVHQGVTTPIRDLDVDIALDLWRAFSRDARAYGLSAGNTSITTNPNDPASNARKQQQKNILSDPANWARNCKLAAALRARAGA